MAAVTIYSDFGAPQIKSTIVSTVSPSICDEVMVFLYVYIDKIFSEEKLKSLLMKVKEESEKAGLKQHSEN